MDLPGMTRRRFLAAAGAGAVGTGLAMGGGPGRWLVERALAAASTGSLSDIDHVVILIQENRSFDHYFGMLPGVNGYGNSSVGQPADLLQSTIDPSTGATLLAGYRSMYPFHFDTTTGTQPGACLNDIDHGWPVQHQAWDNGANDRFLLAHLQANGPSIGTNTMGYYLRADLPFYWDLANAFTVCDNYFCSVLGPTDPNRLYSMSATIDPDGHHGGPLVETLDPVSRTANAGKFTWTTMPEVLSSHGVTWKVYATPDGQLDNVLGYFKAYYGDPMLYANAFTPSFPGTFQADVAAGQLPQVSWVLAPLAQSEHPGAPPTLGEDAVYQLLAPLVANQALWEKTAVFVTFDENGGFFDHVVPPTPPAGTAGEFLAAPLPAAAGGVAGPIGLGFRVPTLVISPFATGGYVCSKTFDHTSILKFLAARFAANGVTVPNISAWRNATVGDMTAAFNPTLASAPPLTPPAVADPNLVSECATNGPAGTVDHGQPYPPPPPGAPAPQQPAGTRSPSPGF